MVYLSIGVRFEANVEALNMVETAGNYSKHRRVPYLIEEDGKIKTVYVPAVSGESLAHAYQEFLVEEAGGLPVCNACRRGEFFKSMNKEHAKEKFPGGVLPKDPYDLEKGIVKACFIEDVGGFLYAEKPPVKRTSSFQFSYALPVKDAAVYALVEPQLHARHAQLKEKTRKAGEASEQMIYYVETGTALYGFTFNLALDGIGYSALTGELVVGEAEVKKRREAAVKAIYRMLSSQQFGAKLSRFFPVGGIVAMAASITEKPFTVTSPIYAGFEANTRRRLEAVGKTFGEKYKLLVLGEEGLETPEEVLSGVVEHLSGLGVF